MSKLTSPIASVKEDGFSLIELMVTIAVAVILLGIGTPSFRDLIQSYQLSTTVNDFVAAIHLTRSEALKRGGRVDLVAIDNDWTKGWTVFVDANNNQKPDASEDVVFTHGPVSQGISVNADLTDPEGSYLAYNGTGRPRTKAHNDVPQFGSFVFKMGDTSRKININLLGRTRVCNPDAEGKNC